MVLSHLLLFSLYTIVKITKEKYIINGLTSVVAGFELSDVVVIVKVVVLEGVVEEVAVVVLEDDSMKSTHAQCE